ncbi:N-acetylmuramoyl-L-alanine amidase family protein [Cytobacillus oceanisediminis]|uniref:N-acetylmuramoyl-L-alanine amidase family protein n=1 Tax=Cytobacillus oceanisediminis TaxID=665099 RepID=UPI002559D6E8|nr:N-acetylmuramoyl-L-alanine amidase [Cytobacillus oceanisediminis]
MVKLFIDPGHGGTDPGAAANGLLEKVLTLKIGLRVRDMLADYNDVQVKMSRETDKTLSLSQRTNAANDWGADFLLSIHINAGGGEGYEDFIYPGVGGATAAHQNTIHDAVMDQIDMKDRGKKSANFHMLRESHMPALLTENGFIDNSSDAAKLKQAAYIDRIARGHVNGLVKAFNLKKKAKAVQQVAENEWDSKTKFMSEWAKKEGISDGKNPFESVTKAYLWEVARNVMIKLEKK